MEIKYYHVKTVDGHVVEIKEKQMPKRNADGRFAGTRATCGGYCRFKKVCPLAM